jgi:type II restriction enzyme
MRYALAMPPTRHQTLGRYGEEAVASLVSCPRCKRSRTLRRLPPNFKCADIICDFCGYLAQVKTSEKEDVETLPPRLLGAAWRPQKERMDAGIYIPLFIVLVTKNRRRKAIFYLPADLQEPELFEPRQPLSKSARRAGWTGFMLRLDRLLGREPVRIA